MTVRGESAPMSGCSSASIIIESPMSSSAWPTLPSGPAMRKRSLAPSTEL